MQKNSGGNWVYPDAQGEGHHICTRYTAQGIRIRLEHVQNRGELKGRYIRMIVNTRNLIYPESGYLGILSPTEESLKLLEKHFIPY